MVGGRGGEEVRDRQAAVVTPVQMEFYPKIVDLVHFDSTLSCSGGWVGGGEWRGGYQDGETEVQKSAVVLNTNVGL